MIKTIFFQFCPNFDDYFGQIKKEARFIVVQNK